MYVFDTKDTIDVKSFKAYLEKKFDVDGDNPLADNIFDLAWSMSGNLHQVTLQYKILKDLIIRS